VRSSGASVRINETARRHIQDVNKISIGRSDHRWSCIHCEWGHGLWQVCVYAVSTNTELFLSRSRILVTSLEFLVGRYGEAGRALRSCSQIAARQTFQGRFMIRQMYYWEFGRKQRTWLIWKASVKGRPTGLFPAAPTLGSYVRILFMACVSVRVFRGLCCIPCPVALVPCPVPLVPCSVSPVPCPSFTI
jgi:hypothetical protein